MERLLNMDDDRLMLLFVVMFVMVLSVKVSYKLLCTICHKIYIGSGVVLDCINSCSLPSYYDVSS